MKRPRLNILRTFSAAGRYQSFSLAADDLNISQAAVSQQMRQLEAYLDTPLFVRHHRRLSLTSTGQAYLNVVLETLDRLDSVTDQLFPGKTHQLVTVRCTSVVAALWLAPQLKSLQARHPNIELRIKTLDQSHNKLQLSRSELEITIPSETAILAQVIKLLTVTITPVCSPELLRSDRPLTAPADILNYELIHVLGYEHDWHRWFRKYQLNDVDVSGGLSVDGSLIAIEAAQRGDGIMLGMRPFIDEHLKSGKLVEVFSEPYHLHTDCYLRQPPASTSGRACKEVVSWLNDLA